MCSFVHAGGGAYAVIDKRVKVTDDDQDLWSNDGNNASSIRHHAENNYFDFIMVIFNFSGTNSLSYE